MVRELKLSRSELSWTIVFKDDYKRFIYERNPELWAKMDAGDLREMLTLKQKLNCKPFKFFMEEVAPGESRNCQRIASN
jgi:predicted metal-binding protein